MLRRSEAVRAGVHRDKLRVMVERGELEKIGRGLYRLIDSPTPTHPDLAAVAFKVPRRGLLPGLSTGLPLTYDADSA